MVLLRARRDRHHPGAGHLHGPPAPAGARVRPPEDRRPGQPAADRPLRRLARQRPRLLAGRGEAARLRHRPRRHRPLQLQGGDADGEARVRGARAGLRSTAPGTTGSTSSRPASSSTSCSPSRSRSSAPSTSTRSSSRARGRWSRPPRSTSGSPRTSTPSCSGRWRPNPDDRYPDARSFADALVDVLFPTPPARPSRTTWARQMHAVYAERIARQRAARAHDALVMKVLRNVAEQQAQAEYERLSTPRRRRCRRG